MGFYGYFKKKFSSGGSDEKKRLSSEEFSKRFSSGGSDEKITLLAELFSETIISSADQTMTSTVYQCNEMSNPVLCPIYVLAFDYWTFAHAMQTIRPVYWNNILDKIAENIWEKKSKIITKEDFFLLTQALFPKLESALQLDLDERVTYKCQIGELMSKLCFGKEHIGADTVLHFKSTAFIQIKSFTELIKDMDNIGGFSE